MEHQSSITIFFFSSGVGTSKKMKINEVADISVSGSEHSDRPDVG
jgi:hypothetical protein